MIKQFIAFCLFFPLTGFSQTPKLNNSPYAGAVVIELFTSQGDVNSPPADKLLSDIIADAEKNNKPVYCLSMHVDFWNRMGWKDPFSSFKYTNRLMNYTSVLNLKETYTPVMIMNGTTVLPSENQSKTFDAISAQLLKRSDCFPEFTCQLFDDTLDVSYDAKLASVSGKSGNDKYINIAIVEKNLITDVTKGDNEGKKLKNDNVTRLLFVADLKTSKGVVRVPLHGQKPGDMKELILFIQDKATRRILGASAKAFSKPVEK